MQKMSLISQDDTRVFWENYKISYSINKVPSKIERMFLEMCCQDT